ncbi:hypothetical protein FXO38_35526 [Capsicum annuum]|uniref:uncharacterized protein LOC124887374 n=1 Tax=Capsicum annuum TaxID=4072 RepID=UPI001FB18935|nr:uncharacterized protein LOC124887374 [Capsicum annuum]KAF3614671.1 hypothetical protein FXO38_35526 [Capsicum annuum]
MKPVVQENNNNNGKVTIKAECRGGKIEIDTKNVDTIKYIEKRLTEKGVQRLERHPADGLPFKHDPKKGHGGKYTWEGPDNEAVSELDPVPPALDEKDPNYEEAEEEAEDEKEKVVVGEVEVAKLADEGVGRIDVDPNLKVDNTK